MSITLTANRKEAEVGLRLTSDTLSPTEATRIIGLVPTRQHVKGERSPGKRIPNPWGCWALEVASDDVEEAARALLAMLGSKREAIAEVAKLYSATVSVSIWWEPKGGQGGYTLPSALLIELASLAERVDFYFASTGEPEE